MVTEIAVAVVAGFVGSVVHRWWIRRNFLAHLRRFTERRRTWEPAA